MTPKRFTFILTGIIILFGVGGLVAFWFSHQALERKADDLSRTLADIMLVNQQLDSFANLERDYQEIAPLQAKVYEVLPDEKRQSEVTLQLDSIVRSAGLQLRGLTFQTTSGRPGEQSQTLAADIPEVLVMPVQFRIVSSYREFIDLLQRIENQQRYMQISNLSISRSDSDLQFNVSLEVFLKP